MRPGVGPKGGRRPRAPFGSRLGLAEAPRPSVAVARRELPRGLVDRPAHLGFGRPGRKPEALIFEFEQIRREAGLLLADDRNPEELVIRAEDFGEHLALFGAPAVPAPVCEERNRSYPGVVAAKIENPELVLGGGVFGGPPAVDGELEPRLEAAGQRCALGGKGRG